MTSDRRAHVEDLFLDALDQQPADLEAWLARATDDGSVRAEVRELLAHAHAGRRAAEGAVGQAADDWQRRSAPSGSTLVGRRVGVYSITAVAGHGGMGAVYRARRADGQFEQDVAVKLVRHGYDTPEAVERFRHERQLLARLSHPGIARLLDGGAAEDEAGIEVPYLVMEFVEGTALTEFCERARLTVEGRLAPFLQVCAAVQHAHQQLIVHRDLKPANILVTPDGQVKLLDFGIAKLLSEEVPAFTGAGAAALTPAYASPEQVTGAPISVATDVYALGLILFELLTGRQAQPVAGDAPLALARAVCDTATPRPSDAVREARRQTAGLARQLAGDLDTIVLKAVHKDPARRYASVEQLAEDLRRHLGGRPVLARPDTVAYRAGKFVRRHIVAAVAVAVTILTLVGALVVTLREARARAAEAARAERRFGQVRTLATTFLFQFHDAVVDLPGSTRARALVLETASEYLQSLASDAEGDPTVQEDLAQAYERLGNIQGRVGAASLGLSKAARGNYEKALAMAERLTASGRSRTDLTPLVVRLHFRLAEFAMEQHADADATRHLQTAVETAERAVRDRPDDVDGPFLLLSGYNRMGEMKARGGDLGGAEVLMRKAIAISRAAVDRAPGVDRGVVALAGSYGRLGVLQRETGHLHEAAATFQAGIEVMAARTTPASPHSQPDLAFLYADLARTLHDPRLPNLQQPREARDAFEKARGVLGVLAAADANDAETPVAQVGLDIDLAAAVAMTDERAALAIHETVAARLSRLIASQPARSTLQALEARAASQHASALARAGRLREARTLFEGAAAVQGRADSAEPLELAWTLIGLAAVEEAEGRVAQAGERLGRARELAARLAEQAPGHVPARAAAAEASARLGVLRVRQHDCIAGTRLLSEAADAWQAWNQPDLAETWAQERLIWARSAAAACRPAR